MVRSQRSGRVRQWRRLKRALMHGTTIPVPPNPDPETQKYILDQLYDFCVTYCGDNVPIDNPDRPPKVLFNILIPPEKHLAIRPAVDSYQSIPVITVDDDPECITLD